MFFPQRNSRVQSKRSQAARQSVQLAGYALAIVLAACGKAPQGEASAVAGGSRPTAKQGGPCAGLLSAPAGALSPETSSQLGAALEAFNSRGAVVRVLVVETTTPESIKDFSSRVGNEWNSVEACRSDVLVVVALKERGIRVATTTNAAAIATDEKVAELITSTFTPAVRERGLGGGLLELVAGLDRLGFNSATSKNTFVHAKRAGLDNLTWFPDPVSYSNSTRWTLLRQARVSCTEAVGAAGSAAAARILKRPGPGRERPDIHDKEQSNYHFYLVGTRAELTLNPDSVPKPYSDSYDKWPIPFTLETRDPTSAGSMGTYVLTNVSSPQDFGRAGFTFGESHYRFGEQRGTFQYDRVEIAPTLIEQHLVLDGIGGSVGDEVVHYYTAVVKLISKLGKSDESVKQADWECATVSVTEQGERARDEYALKVQRYEAEKARKEMMSDPSYQLIDRVRAKGGNCETVANHLEAHYRRAKASGDWSGFQETLGRGLEHGC